MVFYEASAVQPVLPSQGGRLSRTDVAVTLVAVIGSPDAEVAGLVARPLPLEELAHVVAQLGCDHSLYRHVSLRVQSVPVVGGVNVLVDTAMQSFIHSYIHTYIHTWTKGRNRAVCGHGWREC